VRAVPRLCELYPGICLTTEEKSRKNLRVAEILNSDICHDEKALLCPNDNKIHTLRPPQYALNPPCSKGLAGIGATEFTLHYFGARYTDDIPFDECSGVFVR
jgi:hypothetical protein